MHLAARPPDPTLNTRSSTASSASNWPTGNGYRLDGQASAYYPPGYALALGALFWLADLTPVTDDMHTGLVAGLNVGCQLVAVLATFAVARRLVPGRRGAIAGLLAAALVALWPNLIFHTSVVLTESLFLALLLGTMFVAVSGPWGSGRVPPARLVTVGLLFGAATLVRPISVPVLGALVLGWLVAGAGWRRALGRLAVVTGCTVAVLAPWVVRNAVVMDAVVLSTNTGDNLCMSRRVGGSGGFEFPNERCSRGPFDTLPRPALEAQRDAHGRRLALAFVVDHPAEEARLWFRRAQVTFDADADGLSAAEAYGGNRSSPTGCDRRSRRLRTATTPSSAPPP
ncbi:MAG: hypothetical protein H0V33_06935 [Acidimicrobiia bacterium]|nr:hypothetical protein [Acidimicrobiia bacterium]